MDGKRDKNGERLHTHKSAERRMGRDPDRFHRETSEEIKRARKRKAESESCAVIALALGGIVTAAASSGWL